MRLLTVILFLSVLFGVTNVYAEDPDIPRGRHYFSIQQELLNGMDCVGVDLDEQKVAGSNLTISNRCEENVHFAQACCGLANQVVLPDSFVTGKVFRYEHDETKTIKYSADWKSGENEGTFIISHTYVPPKPRPDESSTDILGQGCRMSSNTKPAKTVYCIIVAVFCFGVQIRKKRASQP